MCRWLNKRFAIVICIILPGIVSCGFADLRPIGMDIVPAKSGMVLPGEYSPVIISFDTEMDKQETEGIIQISSSTGALAGDIFWKGNSLYFVPSPPWIAGTRYTLSLSGMIHSRDGRELRLDQYISFYAINKSAPPVLEWFSPVEGASTGTGARIELRFSLPMDRLSAETAFSLEGTGDKNYYWADDDRLLTIVPQKALLPWTVYRWTVKDGAKSREGVPLAKAMSAQFCTDLDQIMPKVLRVFPALRSGEHWLPTGGSIATDLGPGQGIAITFNKPMGENVLRSIRFDPSLAGRTERLSDESAVFIPSRDPEPEIAYTLIIAADTKDTDGLSLGEEYRTSFIPDIPFLQILSFSADGAPALEPEASGNLNGGPAFAVPVDSAGGGVIRFTIRFSLPFNTQAKQETALKITLSPFFPGTLDPIALRFVSWLSDDRLRMEWEGLTAGNSGENHYYRLLMPGGRGGTGNGGGMYFREDQILYLEATP